MGQPVTGRERPIIFSAPMVRAILDGSKTQTRRTVKPQPAEWLHPMPCPSTTPEGWQGPLDHSLWAHEGDEHDGESRRCPYGQPGDRLWVREADANAEGVKHSLHLPGGRFARENFAHLWWTIHGDESWEANPWVWVVEFKRC
jgi:hypothetical protein